MDGKRSERITASMQETFRLYNVLRSKGATSLANACEVEKPLFWDVVVLTTFDATQKICFEQQIQIKKQHGHFPEVPILVVADPVGQKLGVGGSTLHVLTELMKDYGSDLYSKKVLIIHSGGSSQRLPSYSAIGKIFTPVPCEGLQIDLDVPQMLDLKFAMYLPFCQLLGPGIFVTCADDIETYCLDMDTLDLESLKSADVVALAHPSDVKTGEGHGVYVFENSGSNQGQFVNSVQECAEVLQKPTETTMRARGAVFMREDGGSLKEHVWSDSVFWLCEKVCRNLVGWYTNNSPITSELDAYAHFLPCLGTKMKSATPGDFKDYRSEMLPIFKDCSLKVLLLNDSKFYHLGTMEEYLSHLTVIKDFCQELGILKNTSNCEMPFAYKDIGSLSVDFPSRVAVIETYFSDPSIKIILKSDKAQVVVENCQIFVPFKTKGNLIVNNCVIKRCSSITLHGDVDLFSNLLYHTVPIRHNKQLLYVTVAFDLTANMKKASKNISDIFIYGCPLNDAARILGYKEEDIRPNDDPFISLWSARLFVGCYTREESFWLTHNAINEIKKHQSGDDIQADVSICSRSSFFSMKDIVKHKDLEMLLKERESLSTLIKSQDSVLE